MKRVDFDTLTELEKESSSFTSINSANLESSEELISEQTSEQKPAISDPLNERLLKIEHLLHNIWNDLVVKEIDETKKLKWKFAAIVMDRFFLYLSLIYFLVTFCPFILAIKNFYKPN